MIALALVAIAAGSAASCRPQPTFAVTTVVSGLSNPWDMSFAPRGSMFFTERGGRIGLRISGQTRTLATPVRRGGGRRGRDDGHRRDPAYDTNRRLYTCFMSDAGGAVDVRVVRWQVNATDNGLTGRTDILTGIPANPSGRHSGCRIRFGPDGYLWVGTGDAGDGHQPPEPGLARRQGAAHHDRRRGRAGQRGRALPQRDLHVRASQRAGPRLRRRRHRLLDRARARPRRRGQPPRASGQLRVGPGARVQRGRPDDRPHQVPERGARAVELGLADHRPVGGRHPVRARGGRAGTRRWPWRC